jgi:hypothetical protein
MEADEARLAALREQNLKPSKEEKQIDDFYRKQRKKQKKKAVKKSRVVENQKMGNRAHNLNVAIAIVSILIVILIVWILFF